MRTWRRTVPGVSRRAVGAGAVAAVAALVASLLYFPGLRVLDGLFPVSPTTDLYIFLYTGFVFAALLVAPAVALVVGTAVWWWLLSPASTPSRGALAGVVTALVTVLVVPILFGLLLATRDGLRIVWSSPESPPIFGSPVQSVVVVTRGAVRYWSPLTAVILVPLGALLGWAYQRRQRSGGR